MGGRAGVGRFLFRKYTGHPRTFEQHRADRGWRRVAASVAWQLVALRQEILSKLILPVTPVRYCAA